MPDDNFYQNVSLTIAIVETSLICGNLLSLWRDNVASTKKYRYLFICFFFLPEVKAVVTIAFSERDKYTVTHGSMKISDNLTPVSRS